MMHVLIGISLSLGSSFLIMVFATHMTLLGDFKYYKPIYESFIRGDYKFSTLGNFTYFKKGREEIIFFPDGAIQLTNGIYIHLTFISWFSPYSLYYRRKFNKAKDHLIAQHMRETEMRMWKVVEVKKPFKLLRG